MNKEEIQKLVDSLNHAINEFLDSGRTSLMVRLCMKLVGELEQKLEN